MSEIFLKIINMSISASYIILVVLLLRLCLKKAPKWITVVLWGIVALRLVLPFSVESIFSLIPKAEVVSPEIMMDRHPEINTGLPIVNQVVNPIISASFTPDPGTSANPLQLWIPTFAVIWIVGMAALLIYTVISYAKLKRKVRTAVLLRDNIYQSENVASPFVLGIIKPKIYLPFNMSEKDMEHVVAHETAHIRRKDHLWKPLGFLLLTLHWFNPLLWLGYILLCRDIEFACDEKVIKELDHDARADYSEALLACSVNRRMIAACPLAFGEVGVKDRVRSVLSYKKPAFWIIITAVVVCLAVAVCFLTDPKNDVYGETDPDKLSESQALLMSYCPEYFGLDASGGLDVYVWQLAENHYSFGLLPHSDTPREWLSDELMDLKPTNTAEMRDILSTYKIDEDNIYVIPWQNPISSYISDYSIISEGEDIEAKRNAYVQKVRDMLFGTPDEGQKTPVIYSFPLESDADRTLNVHINGFGCDVNDVNIDFRGARYENGSLIFDIHWQNDGSENVNIGPDFEVYKYNGTSYEKLESKGYWLTYIEFLAGKGMNAEGDTSGTVFECERTNSYHVSEHYDVLEAGKYRLEIHGAWVEFEVLITNTYYLSSWSYDTATFDVDGDGIDERCSIRPGRTSGVFTFVFMIQDSDTGAIEYETVFYSQAYSLSFEKGSDGITRVKAETYSEPPTTHLFDISISNGFVNLSENGMPIGDILMNNTKNVELIYDAPMYSYVMDPSLVPEVVIGDGALNTANSSREFLGTVNEITLNKDNFDEFITKFGTDSEYSKLASELRENNKITYELTPDEPVGGIEIYYVMEQKSGEKLIVYGHYENGEKLGEIRFIYRVTQ